jgi:hypothetical protein
MTVDHGAVDFGRIGLGNEVRPVADSFEDEQLSKGKLRIDCLNAFRLNLRICMRQMLR